MANWKKIQTYALIWSLQENKGKVRIFFSPDDHEDYPIESADKFNVISTILGDSAETYFDRDRKIIRTGQELPGPDL